MMTFLYRLYQLLIFFPLFIVVTILVALTTALGCMVGLLALVLPSVLVAFGDGSPSAPSSFRSKSKDESIFSADRATSSQPTTKVHSTSSSYQASSDENLSG